MRTFAELESLYRELLPLPREGGRVEKIVIRPVSGERQLLPKVELSPEHGVHGDRWAHGEARSAERQVTLMNTRVAEAIAGGKPIELAGDNFFVNLDLSESALPAGTRLRMGTAVLEVSQTPHAGCKKFQQRFGADALSWVNHKPNLSLRLRGINCRIITAGEVAEGDAVEVLSG